MTDSANMSAILAAINAALPATVRAYDIDKVPATRPGEYVEVQLSRMTGGEVWQSGRTMTLGYRVTCRAVSSTSTGNVRTSLEKCDLALRGRFLDVGGQRTTPIRPDADDAPGPDDGWFSGLRSYTYCL